MADTTLEEIKRLLEGVGEDVKQLTATVAEDRRQSDVTNATLRGEMHVLGQRIDDHMTLEEQQVEAINQRLGTMEKKVDRLGEGQASMKAKLTGLGAIVGGIASEGLRRLFHQ